MRKYLLFFSFFILSVAISQNIFSQQFTLDSATNMAVSELAQNQNILSQSSFAVVNISSLSYEFSLHIITRLESTLLNTGKFRIVSRQHIETVLHEQNFGLSDYVDENSAQRIGHLLGAKFVLAGKLSKLGNKYFLNFQVLETETGLLIYSKIFKLRNNELRDYERIVAEKKREEQRQRESELTRQKQEESRIKSQESKEKWASFFNGSGDGIHYWSVGVRIGSPMIVPILGYTYWYSLFLFLIDPQIGIGENNWFRPFSPVLTLNGNTTLAPFSNSYLELGFDFSLLNPEGVTGSDYASLYPYVHYNFLIPFDDSSFIYLGGGAGRTFTLAGSPERSSFPDLPHDAFAMDLVVGGKVWLWDKGNYIDGQVLFRYDFQKGYYWNLMLGLSHRFGEY
jgi:TolB-like protein